MGRGMSHRRCINYLPEINTKITKKVLYVILHMWLQNLPDAVLSCLELLQKQQTNKNHHHTKHI